MNTIPRRTIHLHDGELADMLRVAFDPPLAQAATVAGFEDAFTRHAGGGLAIPVGSGDYRAFSPDTAEFLSVAQPGGCSYPGTW